jgi:preprotein translocase subunit YajC
MNMQPVLFERVKLGAFSVITSMALAAVATAQDGPVAVPGGATTTGSAAAPSAAPGWMNLVIFGGMILFMWFFVIRPQQKRQKQHKSFIESLKNGMEVVTSSGLIGRITSITDTIVTLDLGSTSVRVLKHTISGELGKPSLHAAQ